MADLKGQSIETFVLGAVKDLAPGYRKHSITAATRLGILGDAGFHGLIHDVTTELKIDISPEQADRLFAADPTVQDLQDLVNAKLTQLEGEL